MTKCLMNVMPPPQASILSSFFQASSKWSKCFNPFYFTTLHGTLLNLEITPSFSLSLYLKSYIFEVKKIHLVLLFTFKSSASLCSFTSFVFLNYAFPLPQQPSDLFLPQPSNLSFKQWLSHSLAFFHLHLDIRSTASSKPSKETFSFMLASL